MQELPTVADVNRPQVERPTRRDLAATPTAEPETVP